jgi:hypothetical protein
MRKRTLVLSGSLMILAWVAMQLVKRLRLKLVGGLKRLKWSIEHES